MGLLKRSSGAVAALLGMLLLGACAQSRVVLQSDAPPNGDDAIFVLGIEPDDVSVTIVQADVSGDSFLRRTPRLPVIARQAAQGGFLLAHGPGGDTLAIESFHLPSTPRRPRPPEFDTCGKKTLVFSLPKHGIVYVGSIQLVGDAYELSPNYTSEFERAKLYVDSHFPALKGMLKPITPNLIRNAKPCHYG